MVVFKCGHNWYLAKLLKWKRQLLNSRRLWVVSNSQKEIISAKLTRLVKKRPKIPYCNISI